MDKQCDEWSAECGMGNHSDIPKTAFQVPPSELRPRDLAILLLAGGDLRPRQRARDQQADRTGMEIKRRILEEIAALDPEPEELEAVLVRMIDDFGPPTGPTRAVAGIIRDEWQTARATPEWLSQLLAEALRHAEIRPK